MNEKEFKEQHLEKGFDHFQINELLKGIDADIDISIYENPQYGWKQME